MTAAKISCGTCGSEAQLDTASVVRCAEIAAFVAGHRHPAGLAVNLRIGLTEDAASSHAW